MGFLIMSDGTHRLRFLDPADFQVKKIISVFYNGRPLVKLNELEFIKGEIYANIWQTDYIARINPLSGEVLGWIDLTGLLPLTERRVDTDVLNGIAYDEVGDRLFVTGKQWSKIFQITLKRR
jgi:glutamine cyclotransferase